MQLWTYGMPVSDVELHEIRARLITDKKKRKRLKPTAFLGALNAFAPLRLEFEVNRLRGLAFDAGEAGFTCTISAREL